MELSTENYPLFAELNLLMMDIKSALKVFSGLINVGRIWANFHINLAVQIDIDAWKLVVMRNYRDRSPYCKDQQPS